MMKLFVSYARVDKPYCVQIVSAIGAHDIWYDQRLYAGSNWWHEIYRRLEWCEGFLWLLSPDSLRSTACRREFNLALSLGRVIFPLLIHPEVEVPEALRHIHHIDFSRGLEQEALGTLLRSFQAAEASISRPHAVAELAGELVGGPQQNPEQSIREATTAMQQGQYDEAVYLLRRARAAGHRSRFVDLEAVLAEAEAGQQRVSGERETLREYEQIAALVRLERTRRLGCEAFHAFREQYPGHDPEGLAALCGGGTISHDLAQGPAERRAAAAPRPFRLPMLEWCEVPAGELRWSTEGEGATEKLQRRHVAAFRISRYPVTNAQFDVFVQDPQGYASARWWPPAARDWREQNLGPRPSTFSNELRPRERITWYEAMAFCNWLSERLGVGITLPSSLQWMRAARGDDTRVFPWGDEFDRKRCNVRESFIRMTSQVSRYREGTSPCGAQDMAGNVWEWCRDARPGEGVAAGSKRLVHGGSFLSVAERAMIDFHYYLAPERAHASIGFRLTQVPGQLKG